MGMEDTMGATKKGKSAKRLHKGKKMEEQKPLSVTHSDITITKYIDKSNP
jgi:type VI protein secretion system component Hcp